MNDYGQFQMTKDSFVSTLFLRNRTTPVLAIPDPTGRLIQGNH
jgi:hypothetical protein